MANRINVKIVKIVNVKNGSSQKDVKDDRVKKKLIFLLFINRWNGTKECFLNKLTKEMELRRDTTWI